MAKDLIEPEYITWSVDGVEYKQVSPRYKQELLKDYAQRYGCKTFIETGSACGDTLSAMRHVGFHRIFSIELSDYYSGYVARRFEGQSDVTLIHGDSAVELPKLLLISGTAARDRGIHRMRMHPERKVHVNEFNLVAVFGSNLF